MQPFLLETAMLSYARSQGSLIFVLLVLSPALPQVARRDIEEKGKEPRRD